MLSAKARELRIKLSGVLPLLNEKQRRVLVAAEAGAYGRGGIKLLSEITGMSRQTIYRGLDDLNHPGPRDRIRAAGGGRKRLRLTEPKLVNALEVLIEPEVRGDPESLLRWTCKSVRALSEALEAQGYAVGRQSVANLLHERDYRLAGNRKNLDGVKNHPDRNAQFHYINEQAKAFRRRGVPVIQLIGRSRLKLRSEGTSALSSRQDRPTIRKAHHPFSTSADAHSQPKGDQGAFSP